VVFQLLRLLLNSEEIIKILDIFPLRWLLSKAVPKRYLVTVVESSWEGLLVEEVLHSFSRFQALRSGVILLLDGRRHFVKIFIIIRSHLLPALDLLHHSFPFFRGLLKMVFFWLLVNDGVGHGKVNLLVVDRMFRVRLRLPSNFLHQQLL
jgi:hypothetical protein